MTDLQRRLFMKSTSAVAALVLPATSSSAASPQTMADDGHAVTSAAIARFAKTPSPRLRQLLMALVSHLHAFGRDVKLTEEEWMQGVAFLTATGRKSDAERQEFILLSDTLGLSMLVVAMNHIAVQGATEATVLGPFHVDDAPVLSQDADLAHGAPGTPLFVEAIVTDLRNRPIAGAEVDVWQADAEGLYDIQRPELGDQRRGRGRLRSNAAGLVRFRTVVPPPYSVPTDGPVGQMLQATGQHAWRPAHVHFRLEASGYETLVTHLFPSGDPYLRSDAVFGVRPSLIANFIHHGPGVAPDGTMMTTSYHTLKYTFALADKARASAQIMPRHIQLSAAADAPHARAGDLTQNIEGKNPCGPTID